MIDDKNPRYERTLVLMKPDAVQMGLTGEILARFEKAGLKVVAMKMVKITREHADKHYNGNEDWLNGLGQKTFDNFEQFGWNVKERMGTDDKLEIGKMIKQWLIDSLTEAPVVAVVFEGMHAVSAVRKMIGHTIPTKAEPGSIRADFSLDSPTAANLEMRAVRNVVHASGDVDEANYEIEHWFSPEEIFDYTRSHEVYMHGPFKK